MSSANGYKLEVPCINGGKHMHEKVAIWPAPFFVLIQDDDMCPLLIHCQTADEAKRTSGGCGIIYDAGFLPVTV